MEYILHRSKRKSISLQVDKEGTLIVRAPMRCSRDDINSFIIEKANWIEKQKQKQSEIALSIKHFSKEELKGFIEEAKYTIPGRCSAYAQILGVKYQKVSIRCQRTRWGSCSSNGNLSFNCLLTQCPSPVIDYVIIHELCHLIELNHSKHFWNLVESAMPDYKIYKNWLKENGNILLAGI